MAKVDFEDLSGTTTPVGSNPYDGLINACQGDPMLLQEKYELHRVTRNDQQKNKILADDFNGWILDDYLVKLDGAQKQPEFEDPRNCLVFWARPSTKVKNLVTVVQQKLKYAAPDLWLMPVESLHMTAMEISHSLTSEDIEHLISAIKPTYEAIADFPASHRSRLIKPMLSYDAAALALSFVPAAGEHPPVGEDAADDDEYSYHHLRRDLYNLITEAGIEVGSRYVVPSAHLTVARFNSPNVFGGDPLDGKVSLDIEKRRHWIHELEMVNKWLEAEYWPDQNEGIKPGGEWIVGEEKGLDFRKGTLWYGGGESIYIGKGFTKY